MSNRDPLDEDVDLEGDRRRYVLDVFGKLATLTFYEILGVRPSADKKAIKRAYFECAATMHPDRYFGKKLGSYRPKLNAIFARMSEAFATLSDPTKRAAYDEAQAGQAHARGVESHAAPPVDPRVAAERSAAMAALKQRFTERKAKSKEHVAAAERARAAGDLVACAEAYKTALTFAPGDPILEVAYREVQREASQRLVESHRKKAILEERWGRWAEATASWRRVLEAKPDDEEAAVRYALAAAKATPAR
jgi:curved DNA-binding protein CbpA